MNRILLVLVFAASGWAQKFEVASIKPNREGGNRVMIGLRPGGRFNAEGVSVKMLITFAYGIRDYQLTGLPSWADSDRYNISAKPEGAGPETPPDPSKIPSEAEMKTQGEKTRAMVANMLEERFGLKIHRETKELPVYALVVGKNGPKLLDAKEGNPDILDFGGRGRGPGPDDVKQVRRGEGMRMGRGQFAGQEVTAATLATQLSTILGRNVIDKTGLTGKYDVKLSWTPDESQPAMLKDPTNAAASTPDSGPSIFTAIQEQLGLKLDSQKGPVEIVVVDHIEKPTEN